MNCFEIISSWLAINYQWIFGLIIQSFIAYHVFFLSKKISTRARLEHKEKIKKKVDELTAEIQRKKLRRKVYLVNINRYFKDYPANDEKLLSGYSHISAEIKAARFDGVQFFCGIKEACRKQDGTLTFNTADASMQEKIKVFEVGVVPYNWIEHIDIDGDEHGWIPLFFCHFKGKRYWQKSLKRFLPAGYPYKELVYYRISDTYHDGSDPDDWKYTYINEPISNE